MHSIARSAAPTGTKKAVELSMERPNPNRLLPLLALLLHGLGAHELPAQPAGRDSVAAERRARSAQSDFEVRRRNHIPRANFRTAGRCDETIGRWCYWYDETPGNHRESAQLSELRRTLLRTLDGLGSRFPGNDWIAGQRVRYALEARDDSAAISLARACRGTRSLCLSLTALALHAAGEYAAAEVAFDSALLRLPKNVRCAWTDIGDMLEGDLAQEYRKMACDERGVLDRKIWWLTDPLYSIPGNERRTEHLARNVMDLIQRDSRSATGMRWGEDSREILVRYGWPVFWTLEATSTNSTLSLPGVTEHQRTPAFHFFPVVRHLDSLRTMRSVRFSTSQPRAIERYSPRYARSLVEIEPQIARFTRGDSALVVAGFDISGDSNFAAGNVRAAIAVANFDAPTTTLSVSVSPSARHRGALMVRAAPGMTLVSTELMSADSQHVARSRVPIELLPPGIGQVRVSDILLYATNEQLADSLEDAMTHMIGGSRVSGGRKIGLFWEIYDLKLAGTQLPVALTLTRLGGGTMERVLQTLRISESATPLRVRWTEFAATVAVAPRSIVIDLSLIPKGRYELRLTLGPEDKPLASTDRVIDIR